jgi:hypothetical protein
MFLETKASGPRSLNFILESSRLLGRYLEESIFNIPSNSNRAVKTQNKVSFCWKYIDDKGIDL